MITDEFYIQLPDENKHNEHKKMYCRLEIDSNDYDGTIGKVKEAISKEGAII